MRRPDCEREEKQRLERVRVVPVPPERRHPERALAEVAKRLAVDEAEGDRAYGSCRKGQAPVPDDRRAGAEARPYDERDREQDRAVDDVAYHQAEHERDEQRDEPGRVERARPRVVVEADEELEGPRRPRIAEQHGGARVAAARRGLLEDDLAPE